MPQTLTYTVTGSDDNETWTVVANGDTDLDVAVGKTVVLAGAAVGQVSINLPSATGDNQNRIIIVKKTDGTTNNVVVNPDGSETIDGAAFYTLSTQYQAVTIASNGQNWFIV